MESWLQRRRRRRPTFITHAKQWHLQLVQAGSSALKPLCLSHRTRVSCCVLLFPTAVRIQSRQLDVSVIFQHGEWKTSLWSPPTFPFPRPCHITAMNNPLKTSIVIFTLILAKDFWVYSQRQHIESLLFHQQLSENFFLPLTEIRIQFRRGAKQMKPHNPSALNLIWL